MSARITVISGAPGSGKTTISRILAENSAYEKAAHIEVDDFWQYIRKGFIHPWQNGTGSQNETVNEAVIASARSYSKGGYEVYVAGTIGPWFIEPWMDLSKEGIDVRYVVLRPDEETTFSRVLKRQQQKIALETIKDFRQESEYFPLTYEIVKDIWHSFADLGKYESHAIDTTGQTAEESVAIIRQMLGGNVFRI